MPVTFEVDPTKVPSPNVTFQPSSIEDYLKKDFKEQKDSRKKEGKTIKTSDSSKNYFSTKFTNGFVSACLTAYNEHYHLQIGPDEVWISITIALSRYINANAEKFRNFFVSHEGKVELKVFGSGTLYTADYARFIDKLADEIDKNTKGDIGEFLECDFSTSTPVSKIVSKIVLMASMKEYFSYSCAMGCGLPKVTLMGNVGDWEKIRSRAHKLREFNDATLSAWSELLVDVLDNFVAAFSGQVDTDFWNRIAYGIGGGSGFPTIMGWLLVFIAFNNEGRYFLKNLQFVKQRKIYGMLDIENIPGGAVQVPVIVDDNGTIHNTAFFGGAMLAEKNGDIISTALDWAIIDVTESA
eukprot:Phypoly_transcript_09017.p1 GENE.Phypoly_transcript_09017~~Phypoly_transcript_09017.p1  ORF type:complete len:353 (+),score=58.03 Phypoly_transcript_09017:117-1175(+)